MDFKKSVFSKEAFVCFKNMLEGNSNTNEKLKFKFKIKAACLL